ncbi:MAG: zf-HC2 domain-containing protein [Actinomycetota bacterium]|jgi:anti-sigma factor RsiW
MRLRWWRGQELSCRDVGKMLQTYLDGELDELLARRVTRHLEMCVLCGMRVETYMEIKRALRRSAGSPPRDALDRLRAFGQELAEGRVASDERETGA